MRKARFNGIGYKPITDEETIVLQKAIRKYFPLLKDVECENFVVEGTDDNFCLVTATVPQEICGVNIMLDRILFKEGTGLIFKLLKAIDDKGDCQYELTIRNSGGLLMKWPMYGYVYVIERLNNSAEDTDLDNLMEVVAKEGEMFDVFTNFNKVSKRRLGEIRNGFDKASIYQKEPKYETDL